MGRSERARDRFGCACAEVVGYRLPRWRARYQIGSQVNRAAVSPDSVRAVATGPARIADPLAPRAGIQARTGRPACSSASRLWQAVTPEPHMATSAAGGTRTEQRAESPPQRLGGQESSVGAEIAEKRLVAGAGHVARRPGRWSRCGRRSAPRRARPPAGCPGAGAVIDGCRCSRQASVERHRELRAASACAPCRAASPAARHAAKPPSSTATCDGRSSAPATTVVRRTRRCPGRRRRPDIRHRRPAAEPLREARDPAADGARCVAVIGPGKIAVEVQVMRAGRCALGVLRFTPARVAESKRQSNSARSSRAVVRQSGRRR